MTTMLTGHSDDVIELKGDLCDEFYPGYEDQKGTIGLSDGSLLHYEYDSDGIWRFKPIVKGSLFDRIELGSVSEDTFDVVHFKDGLTWAIMTKGEGNVTWEKPKQKIDDRFDGNLDSKIRWNPGFIDDDGEYCIGMPCHDGVYLITTKNDYVDTDEYDADQFAFENYGVDEIRAWAEFPKPYLEKKNE